MPSQDLLQAIRLARAGDKDGARYILQNIIQSEPHNEMAWIWLVDTMPTDAEKIETLNRCLLVVPNSVNAHKALAAIQSHATTASSFETTPSQSPAAVEPEPVRNSWADYEPSAEDEDIDINRSLESFLREEAAQEELTGVSPFAAEPEPAPPVEVEQQPFIEGDAQSEWMEALRQDQLASLQTPAVKPGAKAEPKKTEKPKNNQQKPEEDEEQKKKRKKRCIIVLIGLLGLALAAGAYFLFFAPGAWLQRAAAPTTTPTILSTPEAAGEATLPAVMLPSATATLTATILPTATPAPAISLGGTRITSLEWTSDGSAVIVAYSAGAAVYNAATFELIQSFTAPAERNICRLASDASILACGGSVMNFWSMEDSHSLATYDLPDATGERITALAAAPFSNDVAVAYDLPQPQVRFIFTPTGEVLGNMLQATSQVTQLAFSYNGVSLAFAMQDGSLTLWTLETNELTELREPSEKLLTDVRYSPNNELIAASGENGMVVLWNPQTGERMTTLENDGAARSLSFSADSLWLAVGYDDGAVRLWDMESYTVFQTIPSVGAQANAVAFSPDGTQVAVGYSNGTVEFYTISQPE